MSLEAILAAIETMGETEAACRRAEAESRAQQILDEASRKAEARREEARQAALWPAAGERARRLHRAKLEALQMVGQARNRLVEEVLAETRQRLVALRADPDYPLVLRLLVVEAIRALGSHPFPVDNHTSGKGDSDEGPPVLEADPRDEALLRRILNDLGLNWPVTPSLDCWGGVVARSGDGRVVVMNTLEARLERAASFLRRDLAALFEKAGHPEQSKGSQCPTNEILSCSLAGSE